MLTLRPSEERGPTDLGWLKSRHSFSFGSYYDPEHMGVSKLRVINDDHVEPGAGFAPHSHQDMEIISYVKQGVMEHKDSMGHVQRLPAGEFQLMSAGTGVTHSEYNASRTEPLKFLQIWIEPNIKSIDPGYQQKDFERTPGIQLIVSPDGQNGSLKIHQDPSLYRVLLSQDEQISHPLSNGRTAYLHVVYGELNINGATLRAGDGVTIRAIDRIDITTHGNSEALLFDLP